MRRTIPLLGLLFALPPSLAHASCFYDQMATQGQLFSDTMERCLANYYAIWAKIHSAYGPADRKSYSNNCISTYTKNDANTLNANM